MAEHQDRPETSRTAQSPESPYTVHDDTDAAVAADPTTPPEPASAPGPRGPDPFGLVAGLVTLLVAALALTDTLDALDPRWLLAGVAIGVGVIVLVATVARRS